MGKNEENLTSGKLIKKARLAKNMTINDLAFALDNQNVKFMEKKIKLWELDFDFPDMSEIYKVCEVLTLGPNDLLELRAKKINQNGNKMRRKRKEDNESFLYAKNIIIRTIYLIIVLGFIFSVCSFLNVFIGPGDKISSNIMANQIDEHINNV